MSATRLRRSFAECFRAARERRGLTQVAVANRARMSAGAVSHFETGLREPSLTNLRRLCIAIDVSADALLDLDVDERATGGDRG